MYARASVLTCVLCPFQNKQMVDSIMRALQASKIEVSLDQVCIGCKLMNGVSSVCSDVQFQPSDAHTLTVLPDCMGLFLCISASRLGSSAHIAVKLCLFFLAALTTSFDAGILSTGSIE